MLRVETSDGWWLITHPDHAGLAAAFASHWGNQTFAAPCPRAEVLHAIAAHDDGWAARDARPTITREGRPSAFSHELVGKYSAFEEIDLSDYLAVREGAVERIETQSAYAALLVSLHTCNLLTERADRSTIAPAGLPLLDAFLERQLDRHNRLRQTLMHDPRLSEEEKSEGAILRNFRLLQSTDNLSLLSCVGYMQPATLLHPLATTGGREQTVSVTPLAPRVLRLTPYPLDEALLKVSITARQVRGKTFTTSADLQAAFDAAPEEQLDVTITA